MTAERCYCRSHGGDICSGTVRAFGSGSIDSLIVEVAMSDPLEHSGVDRATDVVSGLLLPEPHSVLVVPLEVGDGLVADITMLDPLEHSGVGVWAETVSAYLPRVHSEDPRDGRGDPWDHRGDDNNNNNKYFISDSWSIV